MWGERTVPVPWNITLMALPHPLQHEFGGLWLPHGTTLSHIAFSLSLPASPHPLTRGTFLKPPPSHVLPWCLHGSPSTLYKGWLLSPACKNLHALPC